MKGEDDIMTGVKFPSSASTNANYCEQLPTHPFSNSAFNAMS